MIELFTHQGMVDPGDTVSRTLRKEFGEEAMNSLEASPEEKKRIEKQINELFKGGHTVRMDVCNVVLKLLGCMVF